MATIYNYEIYSEEPGMQPPVLVALSDLRKQRWPSAMGKKLRALTRAITLQIDEIGEERKRLIEVHAKVGENGEPVTVKNWGDLKDVAGFRSDFQELLNETFEVEGLPFDAVENRELMGETWASPLLEDGAPATEKKVATVGAGGESSGAEQPAADN